MGTTVGDCVGAGEGAGVGETVGDMVGADDGESVGPGVGADGNRKNWAMRGGDQLALPISSDSCTRWTIEPGRRGVGAHRCRDICMRRQKLSPGLSCSRTITSQQVVSRGAFLRAKRDASRLQFDPFHASQGEGDEVALLDGLCSILQFTRPPGVGDDVGTGVGAGKGADGTGIRARRGRSVR